MLQVLLLICVLPLAYAGEPPTEPILRIDPGEHTEVIKRIATDDAGSYLVTASNDKTARVWDLADGKLLSILRVPIGSGNEGRLDAVALSPDGNTVALGGWTQVGDSGDSIFIFDRASGKLLRRLSGLPNVIFHLAFSPDGRLLAATLFGQNNGLRLFSVADGRLLAEDRDYGDDSYSAHFSSDGRLLTTSFDGYLRLYRWDGANLSLLAKRSAPGGTQPYAARFSPDGARIVVGFDNTASVNVLDASNLSLLYAPDTDGVNASLSKVVWSADGQALYAAGAASAQFNGQWKKYIRRWSEGGRGTAQNIAVADDTIMDLAPLSDERLVFGSAEPAWGELNSQGIRTLYHASTIADYRDNQQGFTLSADGAQVRFGYEQSGKSPAVFDSRARLLTDTIFSGLIPPSFDASGLGITDWRNTTTPKLNGMPLKLDPYETSRSLALRPKGEGLVLGTEWNLRAFDRNGDELWRQAAPSAVWAVNVSQDGRWVVAAYSDGTIRWHRVADGAEQMAFFPHADKKRWVLWTPSGYYDASPGAEDLIGWHVNNGRDRSADFFPASRFRDRFHRPDVLAKILETQDEARALQLANEESGRRTQAVSLAQVLPPVVEIVSPVSDSSVQSNKITVRYRVRTLADAPVTGMRVRVNGQALSADRALKRQEDSSDDIREIEVAIPEQDSDIALFAENKNGVSTAALLYLNWAGQKIAAKNDALFRPKLYVLAVGISKYKNPDYNLGLAAKDAKDFAAVFQKQKGKLYGDVVVKLLTDDKATRDDVVDGLDWLKAQVTTRDVGMMFIAGHGMNDNQGKYFFLPHNADPDKLLRTGVAQTDIRDTLNSLAGKAVFFVDTCHAGNALGTSKTRTIGGMTDAFVNELASAENGVIVFSSSTGKQLSQENPAWGNGAFTKALVEGLSGKADFSKTGKITQKGLDYYVTERVKELTHGQQSPVSISPGGVTDFPIAIAIAGGQAKH